MQGRGSKLDPPRTRHATHCTISLPLTPFVCGMVERRSQAVQRRTNSWKFSASYAGVSMWGPEDVMALETRSTEITRATLTVFRGFWGFTWQCWVEPCVASDLTWVNDFTPVLCLWFLIHFNRYTLLTSHEKQYWCLMVYKLFNKNKFKIHRELKRHRLMNSTILIFSTACGLMLNYIYVKKIPSIAEDTDFIIKGPCWFFLTMLRLKV